MGTVQPQDAQQRTDAHNQFWYRMSYPDDANTRDLTVDALYIEFDAAVSTGRVIDPLGVGLQHLATSRTEAVNSLALANDASAQFAVWSHLSHCMLPVSRCNVSDLLLQSSCNLLLQETAQFTQAAGADINALLLAQAKMFAFALVRQTVGDLRHASAPTVSGTMQGLLCTLAAGGCPALVSCPVSLPAMASSPAVAKLLGTFSAAEPLENLATDALNSLAAFASQPPPCPQTSAFVRGARPAPVTPYRVQAQRRQSEPRLRDPVTQVTADISTFLPTALFKFTLYRDFDQSSLPAAVDLLSDETAGLEDFRLSSVLPLQIPLGGLMRLRCNASLAFVEFLHPVVPALLYPDVAPTTPAFAELAANLSNGDPMAWAQLQWTFGPACGNITADIAALYATANANTLTTRIRRCNPTSAPSPVCTLSHDAVIMTNTPGVYWPLHAFLVAARVPTTKHAAIGLDDVGARGDAAQRQLKFLLPDAELPSPAVVQSFSEVLYGNGLPVPGDPTYTNVSLLVQNYGIVV